MGSLFKDFLKLGAAVQKQKQIEKTAQEAREKQELANKIRAQAKEQSAQWLKIVHDCANLVNTTKNPEVFFPRYKLMLEYLEKLAGLESTGIFRNSKELPSEALLRIEKQFPAATENFLDRSFEAAKEKAETLKTEKAKGSAIARYFADMEKYIDDMAPENVSYLEELKKAPQSAKTHEEIMDEINAWGAENSEDEEARRYYRGQLDKQYQADLSAFFDMIAKIREMYTVINTVASFSDAAGDNLIELCNAAIELDDSIRAKREYYDGFTCDYSDAYKTLAMVWEARGDYERAALVCVSAIQKGYTRDGTSGGMRGRLARMIKKGGLPLTEGMKDILGL